MKKIVSIAALIAASLPVAFAQTQVITAWTFENNAIAVNNSPAPSTGSGTASSIGMATYATPNIGVTTDDVLAGSAGDTGVNGVADLTQIWRVRAQAGSSGAANGWSSTATIGTQGAMFAASTAGYTNITVSFDWYATNQGEGKLQLQYTTDGSTWHNVPLSLGGSDSGLALLNNSTSANTVNGWYVSITGGAGQDWFTGLTATISDPNAANNPKFAIEMVNAATGADCTSASGGALNNTSGNWRFDNVVISGESTFTGFSAGNLVLSRSVYTGDPSTVVIGSVLPPVCPASANAAASGACGAKATNSGAYPSTSSSNNVWNNDSVDGSFGITSPIYLDQISPSGTTLNSFAVPSNMIVTSFSSKSELALNLSTDGSVLTFMGYVTAPNTVDVSNSNTPGIYDPTNPSGGSYFRAVAQVDANGAIQVTPTNAYSGNNGRAAILANGLYYMTGNANNGTTTPTNVVTATGVEIATPGQAANTTPTEVGDFSITQVTNPSTGSPYAADKLGKDNNFRGLTIFNNTLYVTKGSGGNGIDTVYQVGNGGALPTLANAASAPITILPGFPVALIGHIQRGGVGEPDPERIVVGGAGGLGGGSGKSRQHGDGRRGRCGERRQAACVPHLIHRIDTVAAAALGDVNRVVEDGESAEIIVLAQLVRGVRRARGGIGYLSDAEVSDLLRRRVRRLPGRCDLDAGRGHDVGRRPGSVVGVADHVV